MKKISILLFSIFCIQTGFSQGDSTNILSNGTYVDGTISMALMNGTVAPSFAAGTDSYSPDNSTSIGLRVANQWYFWGQDNYRSGLQITWARSEFGIANHGSTGRVFCSLAPINVGFSNIWKRNNNNAVELNFNGGLMLYSQELDFNLMTGVLVGPQLRFRKNRLIFGIDLDFMYVQNTTHSITKYQLTLSVGVRQKQR